MAFRNLISATNDELIFKITETVINSYFALRIINIRGLTLGEHFERREAKITFGLFDGSLPSPEDFEAIRDLPKAKQPKFYSDIVDIVTKICLTFYTATGKSFPMEEININHRALLWSIMMKESLGLTNDLRGKPKRGNR